MTHGGESMMAQALLVLYLSNKPKSLVTLLISTLYQFILATDEKPTVVYPIPDEISVRYFIWDRIYYGRCHIPGNHLGWNIYSRIFLLPGTLTRPELKLLSCAQNCKIPGHTMCYFEVAFTVSWCKIPGRTTHEHEMLILLAIPRYTYIRNPKIFCITMQNGGSGGTFVRYRYHKFYRSRASCFRHFTMLLTILSASCISTIFPAFCIYINCTTFEIANFFFKTKKTTSHQMYKGYS